MINIEPGQNRYGLGFKEEVLNQFSFLKDYGFSCIKEEVTFVRYESQNVFINIYHGRASYELGLEIGLMPSTLGIDESKFTLTEIIEHAGVQKNDTRNVYFQASTAEAIKENIPILAKLVKKYAVNALVGDVSTFVKLELIQKQMSDKYLKKMELNRIRPKAEAAWHNKKYIDYIELYEHIQEDISPAEVKKLEYARRHISPK